MIKKAALETIYNYQAQGAYVRSRANHKVEGERPSRMFCALEKYNGTQKYVPQLIVSSENDISRKTGHRGVARKSLQTKEGRM